MTSKAHIVGDYLLKSNRRDIQIMGYDMVEKNAKCLREQIPNYIRVPRLLFEDYTTIESHPPRRNRH